MTHAPDLSTGPMGLAAAREGVDASAPPTPFAHCEVFEDLKRARAPWAELEAIALASPYQRYDFVETWQQTIGRGRAITPMIIVARDERGAVNAILPLGRSRRGPAWAAEFLGGADANFKMGLFRPGIAATGEAIVALLRRAARMTRPRVDVFWLTNQPLSWQGAVNPLAVLPHCPSPSFGHKSTLAKDFNLWLIGHQSKEARRKLRQKTQRLNAIGPVTSLLAQDETSARAILAAFLRQKEARMDALGLANPYEDPDTIRFFDIAATRRLTQGAPVLELHALKSGERIVATFGGVAQAGRFCGMFISYDADPEIARCSPGQLLIIEAVRNLSARGFVTFDLGVGEARYKDANCEAEEPLFDAAVAVNALGAAGAAGALLMRRVKRWTKHTPWALDIADRLRRKAFSLRGGATRRSRISGN